MDCEGITKSIGIIFSKTQELGQIDDPLVLLAKQEEIEGVIDLVEREIACDYRFLEVVKQEIVLDRLAEIYGDSFQSGELDLGLFYLDVEDYLDGIMADEQANLTSNRYKRFLDNLLAEDLSAKLAELSKLYTPFGHLLGEDFVVNALRVLNSYLINRFHQKGKVIDISDVELPDELTDYLGMFLNGAHVKAGKLKSNAGAYMRSGIFEIESGSVSAGSHMEDGLLAIRLADDYLGEGMKGGKIKCFSAQSHAGANMSGGEIDLQHARNMLGWEMDGGKIKVDYCHDFMGMDMQGGAIVARIAGNNVGQDMKGGSIYCQNAEDSCASGAEGGSLAIGGLADSTTTPIGFMATELSTILSLNRNAEFDTTCRSKSYVYTDHGPARAAEADIRGIASHLLIQSEEELESFKVGDSGLKVVDTNAPWLSDDGPMMLGAIKGILVWRGMPKTEIGIDGGILIIDAPETDPKEVRRMIADKDNRKPGQGLILMRISDRNGGFKLIDLEEEN